MNDEPLLLSPSPPRRRAHDVHELPERALQTYARLWQLETWLRRMVYVELRSYLGDDCKSKVNVEKAEFPQKEDKALVHMPSPEEDPLSYVQLSRAMPHRLGKPPAIRSVPATGSSLGRPNEGNRPGPASRRALPAG